MHNTVDDIKFCDSQESVHVKYKSRQSTWLLVVCDTSFYSIILFQEYQWRAKGFCQAWSGSILSAKFLCRQQSLPLADGRVET